jgi:hypothetical protein
MTRQLLLAAMLAVGTTTRAQDWSVTLDVPDLTGGPGETLVYTGTIANDTGAELTLSAGLEFATSPSGENYFVPDFSAELLAEDLIIAPGGFTGPIFSIQWTPETPFGVYGEGALIFFPTETAVPAEIVVPFTGRVPGVTSFCTESTLLDGVSAAIAVNGATGSGHIAIVTADGELQVATLESGVWTTSTVGVGLGAVGRPAIEVDGDGFSHVAYFDEAEGDLNHATNRTGSWVVTQVDTAGVVGAWPALAFDLLDQLHVSYQDVTNGALKHGVLSGSTWTTEVVEAGPGVGSYTSLALDDEGNPWIAYRDDADLDLEVAHHDGSGWILDTVEATDNVGTWTAIAVAGSVTHVAYRDETLSELRLATRMGGGWTFDVIDAEGDPGLFTTLDLDSALRPHVTYGASSGQTRYAVRATPTLWEGGMIDPDPAGSASMALSPTDEPFVAYVRAGGEVTFAAATSCQALGVGDSGAPTVPLLAVRPARPNPFGAETVIAFDLGRSAHARVNIYDAAGRRVRDLLDARMGRGPVRVTWDGRNDRGLQLGAGVYWFRVDTGEASRTGRLVMVR